MVETDNIEGWPAADRLSFIKDMCLKILHILNMCPIPQTCHVYLPSKDDVLINATKGLAVQAGPANREYGVETFGCEGIALLHNGLCSFGKRQEQMRPLKRLGLSPEWVSNLQRYQSQ